MGANMKISVIIPCYNEENYIKTCLESIIRQTYKNLEIIVIDGKSSDKTMQIVNVFVERYDNIKVFQNEKRYTPYAFNIGIEHSEGSIICIVGVHAYYPKEYIEKCVQLHRKYPDVANVGGRIIICPIREKICEFAIAIAVSNKFGVGSSSFRTFKKKGFVKTLFPGSYKSRIFTKYGLYDERLIRGQDQGFNKRITNAGEKIYFDPEIKVYYYSRSNLKKLSIQFYKTGKSIIYTSKTLNEILSVRQIVPLIFMLSLIITISFGLLAWGFGAETKHSFLPLILCGVPYLTVNIVISTFEAIKKKRHLLIFLLPITFIVLHMSYGVGTLIGLVTLRNWWKKNKDYKIRYLK